MRAVVVKVGATIEALHKPILHWFPRHDVVPINPAVFLPLQGRIRSYFRTVVADH